MVHVTDNSRKAFRNVRDSMGKALKKDAKEFRRMAGEKLEEGKQKFYDAEQRVEDYIADHPRKATIWAVGVGAIIGALLTASIMKNR